MKQFLGKKIGMTRIFTEGGASVPVTVIEAGPCRVTQVKTTEKDGYRAVQVAFGEKRKNLINKPLSGHLKKSGLETARWLGELKLEDADNFEVGQRLDVSVLHPGDVIKVSGISKGLGFQGAVRRHHFAGGPKTHGQSDRHRAPGSVGASSFPSRTFRGQRMAGRMGGETVTVKNLKVVDVDKEHNALLVKGAVPGKPNGLVKIEIIEPASERFKKPKET
ncbi:MAG: 50S ribosomal protein L3 [candidate division Zixibacteria bacterium]|nr:50S ribosomal protein L3 [candidate division Zixibacteria bacterium]MCI0596951.1 50S ribosomal protein L3 [candidate division Zixibacteria bacterium]